MPELLPGLNRICRDYQSYIVAFFLLALWYFLGQLHDMETAVSANTERSTTVAVKLDTLDEKIDRVAEDTAEIRGMLERGQ